VPASYGEIIERYSLAHPEIIEYEFQIYGAEILDAEDEP
jgi:hypothetical protein